jgi:hypothetical protein
MPTEYSAAFVMRHDVKATYVGEADAVATVTLSHGHRIDTTRQASKPRSECERASERGHRTTYLVSLYNVTLSAESEELSSEPNAAYISR